MQGEHTAGAAGVYDTRGRLVRDLIDATLSAGPHVVAWNGLDALDRPAAPGVYIARFESPIHRQSWKMILAK